MSLLAIIRTALIKMADHFTQLVQQALQRNTKSTVLKSLGWLVGILSATTVFSSKYSSYEWLVVLLAVLDALAVIVYIGFFMFFAFKDPDLLRSEKYSIQKMAIQHGLIGDDLSGLFKIPKIGDVPLLEGSKTDENKKGDK
jgi:hypothetical protein